ncbi:MAG: hypothetical protein ABFS45_17215 [Pseudomonadota bacterium]
MRTEFVNVQRTVEHKFPPTHALMTPDLIGERFSQSDWFPRLHTSPSIMATNAGYGRVQGSQQVTAPIGVAKRRRTKSASHKGQRKRRSGKRSARRPHVRASAGAGGQTGSQQQGVSPQPTDPVTPQAPTPILPQPTFTRVPCDLTFGPPTDISRGWDGTLWAIDASAPCVRITVASNFH